MTQTKHLIPTQRNLLLLVLASIVNIGLLYFASHSPWWAVILAAGLFSLSNNTLFALLHESVHGILTNNKHLNRFAGSIAALWFPTGWLIQRSFHLTHHEQNRSLAEQFDVLHPQDIIWLKYAQWYSIYTGLYWLITVIGLIVYALSPRLIRQWLIQIFGQQGASQTSANNYIGILDKLPPVQARLEIFLAIGWQLFIIFLLDLSLIGYCCCYGSFALMWSSLQYTDHAFSPLDRYQGAWNLRVPSWLRTVFLNYHLHLAHHQHPQVPWLYLPQYADKGPRFIDVWLSCWRGPRPLKDFPTFHQEKTW